MIKLCAYYLFLLISLIFRVVSNCEYKSRLKLSYPWAHSFSAVCMLTHQKWLSYLVSKVIVLEFWKRVPKCIDGFYFLVFLIKRSLIRLRWFHHVSFGTWIKPFQSTKRTYNCKINHCQLNMPYWQLLFRKLTYLSSCTCYQFILVQY